MVKISYQLWIQLCELEIIGLNPNILILNLNGLTSIINNKIGIEERLDVEKKIFDLEFQDFQINGKLSSLWISFANWYLEADDLKSASYKEIPSSTSISIITVSPNAATLLKLNNNSSYNSYNNHNK
ncbi:hypothetical protein U3516DRAFT_672105 [Neocallimastix sp. 'constans']